MAAWRKERKARGPGTMTPQDGTTVVVREPKPPARETVTGVCHHGPECRSQAIVCRMERAQGVRRA